MWEGSVIIVDSYCVMKKKGKVERLLCLSARK